LEDRNESLESRSDFDAHNPSDRLQCAWEEIEHCTAERKKLTEAQAEIIVTGALSTPNNLSL
jgi:hypothetical protein